jgi:hypothetical protein
VSGARRDCFGAGVYGPRDKHRESILMGSFSTMFQAEVMAILMRTALLLFKNVKKGYISALITRQQ